MILDVNVLIYAADSTSPHHETVSAWLATALTGDRRVGIPWQTVGGFVRIVTHPRAMRHPLTTEQAWSVVDSWFAASVVWVPAASERTSPTPTASDAAITPRSGARSVRRRVRTCHRGLAEAFAGAARTATDPYV